MVALPDMVLILEDGAIGHADPVGLPLLDHPGDALCQEHAGFEFITNRARAVEKIPGNLVGLLRGGIAIVAEDNVRHHRQSRRSAIVPAASLVRQKAR
jgi:hypothetical protein